MKILDGKDISNNLYRNFTNEIIELKEKNIIPGLAVLLIGERTDSIAYVNMKHKKCQEIGIKSTIYKFKGDEVTNKILEDKIKELNDDSLVHGILIQLPLPKHLDRDSILSKVSLNKDVDGFHFENMGRLAIDRNPLFTPCTPDGCIEILKMISIDFVGKKAVVIGKSAIVGLPLSLMLLNLGATVTVCHIDTKNIKEETKTADILFVACGSKHLVKQDWIKENVIIIDIGINSVEDKTKKRGYRLVGDVDFEDVKDKVSYITPVPGGVGPMTICMLMKHTLQACKNLTLVN